MNQRNLIIAVKKLNKEVNFGYDKVLFKEI